MEALENLQKGEIIITVIYWVLRDSVFADKED